MHLLITAAHAQTAEAVQAGEKVTEKLLNEGGYLGLLCVVLLLGLVGLALIARTLYRDNQALHAVRAAEAKSMTEAIGAFKNALEGVEEALQGNKTVLETRAQAIADLGHHIERTAQDARHAFANLSQALAGILEWVRRDRTGGAP